MVNIKDKMWKFIFRTSPFKMSFIFRSFLEDFKLCDHQFKRRILKKLKENFFGFGFQVPSKLFISFSPIKWVFQRNPKLILQRDSRVKIQFKHLSSLFSLESHSKNWEMSRKIKKRGKEKWKKILRILTISKKFRWKSWIFSKMKFQGYRRIFIRIMRKDGFFVKGYPFDFS